MFTNKKREGINRFVCDVSLYVAETPKASIKYHKPPLSIIPFGIVAYGFVGQPFSKQLYTNVTENKNSFPKRKRDTCNKGSFLFILFVEFSCSSFAKSIEIFVLPEKM